MATGGVRPTVEQALLKFLKRCHVTENRCLIWPGATSGYGYPVATVNGRGTFGYLHRIIYHHAVGYIPDGYVVDHICTNKLCLNPDHLRILTASDNNVRDRWTDSNLVYDYLRSIFNEPSDADDRI